MDKTKRILILINKTNGLYSFRKEVMKAIVDADYELYISVPDEDERIKFFEDLGCHIIKTNFDRRGMNPIKDFKLLMEYRKLIKLLKPKAVLTYTIKPNVYGGLACRITKTPQLANVTGLGDAIENGGWLQRLTVILYRMGLKEAACVFFQNESNRNTCIRLGIVDDSSLLLPGSGVSLVHHKYQAYPSEDGPIKFLFIGRLLRDKGIEEYFETAKAIKEKYPNTEFQMLGAIDGPYKEKLDECVKSGIVNHLGETYDVRPFLGAVHCTIMPSYHEGMSNVNLESSANGRPVITTDVPGCRETVDNDKTGYLVTPKDANSLIEAVERFVLLPYSQKAQMGRNGREKVEREFDRKIVINAYLDALNKL